MNNAVLYELMFCPEEYLVRMENVRDE